MSQGMRVALGVLVMALEGRLAFAAAPTFAQPLSITNAYHPFQPGGVKVFRGRKGATVSVIVDLYLTGTRTFHVGATDVPTRILQETEFEGGDVGEISQNFFAQADDRMAFHFGSLARSA